MQMKKNKKNKKGFSFLEVVITIGIFSFISIAVVGAFASIASTGQKTRLVQKKLESAGTAMESMGKIIRMSDNILYDKINDPNNIYMRNTSQNKCIQYSFDSASKILRTRELSVPGTPPDPTYCADPSNYASASLFDLISNVDDVKFEVVAPDPTTAGMATILIFVDNKRLQTTVSFLNYE